jgi:hypothetical protein
MLSVAFYCYVESHSAECRYAECLYAKCHCTECHGAGVSGLPICWPLFFITLCVLISLLYIQFSLEYPLDGPIHVQRKKCQHAFW